MMLSARSIWKKSYHSSVKLIPTRSSPTRTLRFFSSAIQNHDSFHSSEEEYNFGSYSVILPEEPFVFGVSHIKPRCVPETIQKPLYAGGTGNALPRASPWESSGRMIPLGGEEERKLRDAARLARDVREFSGTLVKAGTTTDFIDAVVHEYIISHAAYPSPLLYKGFPKSCCTSVNNIITHGIPDNRPLEDGDIVNIDITVYLNGYHGDTSQTWLVGDVDLQGRTLCSITTSALEAGIKACAPGKPFKDIGRAIHRYVNGTQHGLEHGMGMEQHEKHQGMEFCISTQFTGHGIGEVFHREPWILHHLNDEPGVMLPGDCFTIEPAIIQGRNPSGWIFPDGWSVSTENCARSAQAEHMVLITEGGVEVLTR